MNNIQNRCTEDFKLWRLINNLEKIRKTKIILTPEQRFSLCNYINGKPYNRNILKKFIF
jgi:hypothetical protein